MWVRKARPLSALLTVAAAGEKKYGRHRLPPANSSTPLVFVPQSTTPPRRRVALLSVRPQIGVICGMQVLAGRGTAGEFA